MLVLPSLRRCKKTKTIVAFFVALQEKKEKKAATTLLLSPSFLCYNKTKGRR
jgi:hypothetical protein